MDGVDGRHLHVDTTSEVDMGRRQLSSLCDRDAVVLLRVYKVIGGRQGAKTEDGVWDRLVCLDLVGEVRKKRVDCRLLFPKRCKRRFFKLALGEWKICGARPHAYERFRQVPKRRARTS